MNFENMQIDKVNLVIKHTSAYRSWDAKNRKDHIIGIAFSGDEIHDFGYKKFTIGENCIFFLNQKDDFKAYANEFATSYSIHFTTNEEVTTDSFCIKVNNMDEMITLFEKIDRQNRVKENQHYNLYSNIYKLFGMFNDICAKKYAPTDLRMVGAKEYIDLNFTDKNCLEDAYNLVNVSRRHFDRLFKSIFNVTPSRYIILKKVQFAQKLLKTQGLSIEEISSMCGFSDVYYFSKVFKAETGLTPSSYRHF